MKNYQVKQMDNEQLNKKLFESRRELLRLESQRAVGATLESPGLIKSLKKDIARMLTYKQLKLKGGQTKKI
ncbi:50S ribosomal protein L29 [Candidatus Woesearchaeota archaeon]|nr:50S ribosomal protein L29 [Candidatus Woesearchaeota archaeon]